MLWKKEIEDIRTKARVPILSWCDELEDVALKQAENLAAHPMVDSHVALMPDCHMGYGMPIGGVIGSSKAVIPNAVGVDIGCGMCAVETGLPVSVFNKKNDIRDFLEQVKTYVPIGEKNGHRAKQKWHGFSRQLERLGDERPAWFSQRGWDWDQYNLGTLGGGNHFIELQRSEDGKVWLMIHSGSRNLGYRIADCYHKIALDLNRDMGVSLPDNDLAFLPIDSAEGQAYIRDMNYAMDYAMQNRQMMMKHAKLALQECVGEVEFIQEINIHHNYAALEEHNGQQLWIHRKGATSALDGQMGIIPGSMGASSYIVKGLGNSDSFSSCSHGAGRVLGRNQASRTLTPEECDKAMGDIVYDRWKPLHGKRRTKIGTHDLGEAPQAYKNIDRVIANEHDLVEPVVKLRPLGVIKG